MGLSQKSKARAKINKISPKFNLAHHPTPSTFCALHNTQGALLRGGHYYIIASADYTEGAEGIITLLPLSIIQRAQRDYYIIQRALTHYRYKCNLVEFIIFKHGSVNRTSDPLTFCGSCAIL